MMKRKQILIMSSLFGITLLLIPVILKTQIVSSQIMNESMPQNNLSRDTLAHNSSFGQVIETDQNNFSALVFDSDEERKIILPSEEVSNITELSKQTQVGQNLTLGEKAAPICTTLDGTPSNAIGMNEQIPCTVVLSNPAKEISIDMDYETLLSDDSTNYLHFDFQEQDPQIIQLAPGEILAFSREGGDNYDFLDIYLVDENVPNGEILKIDPNNFARVFLDHFNVGSIDLFRVPNIDVGFSAWKLVIVYTLNPELEAAYFAENVLID